MQLEIEFAIPRCNRTVRCFQRIGARVQTATEHIDTMLLNAWETIAITREFRTRDLPISWSTTTITKSKWLQPHRNRARKETLSILHDEISFAMQHVLRFDR